MSTTTTTGTSRELLRYLAAMGHALPEDAKSVLSLRRYYDGDQVDWTRVPASVRNVLRQLGRTVTGEGFSVNACARVVDALVAGLNIIGLESQDATVAEETWAVCEANQFDRVTDRLFTAAAVEGEAYLITDQGEEGAPTAAVNRRWDGTYGVSPIDVDGDGELVACQKRYPERVVAADHEPSAVVRVVDWFLERLGLQRTGLATTVEERSWRIVYEPDRIRAYCRTAGREELVEDSPWPYGMPVHRFTSPTAGELTPSILSVQDLINDAALTLAHAARVDGFRILYTMDAQRLAAGTAQVVAGGTQTGAQPEDVIVEPGLLLSLESRRGAPGSGTVNVVPPGDLGVLQSYMQGLVELLFMLSGTPTYLLPWAEGRLTPSGKALKIANGAFDAKRQRYQDAWSPRFAAVFAQWRAMMGRAPAAVMPRWSGEDYHDLAEAAQAAPAMQQTGVDEETIWQVCWRLTQEQMERSRAAAEAVNADRQARLEALMPPTEEA